MLELSELAPMLQKVVEQRWGGTAESENLFVFEEGHAGLTLGFSVSQPDMETHAYVLKLAPPGVKRKGNTDVYKQAPLLRALRASGLPVPSIPHASPDEADLGTPYIVMERLAGRTFVIWEPHPSFDLAPQNVAPLWRQAAQALAKLHAFDWQRLKLSETPRTLSEERTYWDPILAKSPEQHWVAAGKELAANLAANQPAASPIGVVHGDYQPGNILYDRGVLTGVIDWELAGIGPQNLDVGWLLMMADPECWHADWQPNVGVDRIELLGIYEDSRGCIVDDIHWYQALACYRMGAIACLNVRLHRTGRRPDALWDRFAPSIDTLFARGEVLLHSPALAKRRL